MDATIQVRGLHKRFGPTLAVRASASRAAAAVLAGAGAMVAEEGGGVLSVSGLSSERIVALLAGNAIPFAEVSAHRATLEQAYLELTRDAVEFRARGVA
jgi:ABC-2 type transport system ATP-binding protein